MPFFASANVEMFGVEICETDPCKLVDVFTAIGKFIDFVAFRLLTPLAIIALAYAGILMISGASNPGQVGKAKDIIYYTIIGILFVFGAYVIINTVTKGLANRAADSFKTKQ